MSLSPYLQEKIELIPESDCWWWMGTITWAGYGQVSRPAGNARFPKAHRAVYEELVGKVPDGLVLDHLCRNRLCVNPKHLEPVTIGVNVQRGDLSSNGEYSRSKTHCPQGHAYAEHGGRRSVSACHPKGGRICKICRSEQRKRWKENN
jgi:hypothetical protein